MQWGYIIIYGPSAYIHRIFLCWRGLSKFATVLTVTCTVLLELSLVLLKLVIAALVLLIVPATRDDSRVPRLTYSSLMSVVVGRVDAARLTSIRRICSVIVISVPVGMSCSIFIRGSSLFRMS
jgi:hypothetical protein